MALWLYIRVPIVSILDSQAVMASSELIPPPNSNNSPSRTSSFLLAGRSRLCQFCLFFIASGNTFVGTPFLGALSRRARDFSLVARICNHQLVTDSIQCTLQPHCRASSLFIKTCSTDPVIKTWGPKRIVESAFLATTLLQGNFCFPPLIFAQKLDCRPLGHSCFDSANPVRKHIQLLGSLWLYQSIHYIYKALEKIPGLVVEPHNINDTLQCILVERMVLDAPASKLYDPPVYYMLTPFHIKGTVRKMYYNTEVPAGQIKYATKSNGWHWICLVITSLGNILSW